MEFYLMKLKLFEAMMEVHTGGWLIEIPSLIAAPSLQEAEKKAQIMELEYNLGVVGEEPSENLKLTDIMRKNASDKAADAKDISYTLSGVSELDLIEGYDGKLYHFDCYSITA